MHPTPRPTFGLTKALPEIRQDVRRRPKMRRPKALSETCWSVVSKMAHSSGGPTPKGEGPTPHSGGRGGTPQGRTADAEGDPQTLRQACYRENPESAMCVQNLNDSRGLAIRITYRISLRSSSLWEPRHPPLKVVNVYPLVWRWGMGGSKLVLTIPFASGPLVHFRLPYFS